MALAVYSSSLFHISLIVLSVTTAVSVIALSSSFTVLNALLITLCAIKKPLVKLKKYSILVDKDLKLRCAASVSAKEVYAFFAASFIGSKPLVIFAVLEVNSFSICFIFAATSSSPSSEVIVLKLSNNARNLSPDIFWILLISKPSKNFFISALSEFLATFCISVAKSVKADFAFFIALGSIELIVVFNPFNSPSIFFIPVFTKASLNSDFNLAILASVASISLAAFVYSLEPFSLEFIIFSACAFSFSYSASDFLYSSNCCLATLYVPLPLFPKAPEKSPMLVFELNSIPSIAFLVASKSSFNALFLAALLLASEILSMADAALFSLFITLLSTMFSKFILSNLPIFLWIELTSRKTSLASEEPLKPFVAFVCKASKSFSKFLISFLKRDLPLVLNLPLIAEPKLSKALFAFLMLASTSTLRVTFWTCLDIHLFPPIKNWHQIPIESNAN